MLAAMREKDKVKKRDWSAISIDILESALTPSSKTRLMYKSNLNYARFKKYFQSFLKKGLIEQINHSHGKTKIYMTSERGKILLEALKKAESIFSETQIR